MTADQLGGVVRALLSTLAGILVTHGYVSDGVVEPVVGAITTIVVALWSYNTNQPEKLK